MRVVDDRAGDRSAFSCRSPEGLRYVALGVVALAFRPARGGPSFASPQHLRRSLEGRVVVSLRERLAGTISSNNQIGGQESRAGLQWARVVEEQRGLYRVAGDADGWAEVSGRFRHEAAHAADFPAVGDWVGVERGIIHRRLERRSTVSRAAAGRAVEQQVLAANVDTIFLVTALGQDLNPRRLERYLTMVWDGGAVPVVLLNKSDLSDDPMRSRRRCPRAASARRRRRRQRAAAGDDRRARRARAVPAAGADRRAPRLVRRRQVDARQPAGRPRGAAGRRDQRDRRQGAAHDDVAAARGAARRRAADRHARDARAAAVGGRRGGRRGVRRHRGAGGRVPLRRLRPRRRAGLRGARRGRTPAGSTPIVSRTTGAWGAKPRSRNASATRRPPRRRSAGGSRSTRRRGRCTGSATAASGRMPGRCAALRRV